jgi:selenocysteine lyase/cysteine desulfurase
MDREELAGRWPDATGYLLNHSAGLPPLDAREALSRRLFDPWSARDDRVWNAWLEGIDDFRRQLARVIRHEAASICPQPNVSAALSSILGALPVREGRRRLLLAERAFPSLGFVFTMAERSGFEVEMIPRTENTLDPAVWEARLDERVHCALFTHVHSNTSECHDIAPLCALARRCGAVSIVDVAQSIGIRRVDANAWGADFIVGSCLKWLCGGSGAGFLWVDPARIDDCQPIDLGWFSHADPFEFDIHHFEYANDALRFWGGTPSVAPALVAGHAIGALLDLGLERIEAHNRELTATLAEQVPAAYLVSPQDPARRGGSVMLHAGDAQSDFVRQLREAGVLFDERPEGARISPHFYNTVEDIETVVRCVPHSTAA